MNKYELKLVEKLLADGKKEVRERQAAEKELAEAHEYLDTLGVPKYLGDEDSNDTTKTLAKHLELAWLGPSPLKVSHRIRWLVAEKKPPTQEAE